MEANSTPSLIEKLQSKMQDDRQQIELLTLNVQQQLAQNLKQQSIDVLNITLNDIKSETISAVTKSLTEIQRQISIKTSPMLSELDSMTEKSRQLDSLNSRLDSLTKQLSDTETQIVKHKKSITKSIDENYKQIETALESQLYKILWAIKIPFMIMIGFCVLAGIMTALFVYMTNSEIENSLKRSKLEKLEMNYLFCKTPAGRTLDAQEYCKGMEK